MDLPAGDVRSAFEKAVGRKDFTLEGVRAKRMGWVEVNANTCGLYKVSGTARRRGERERRSFIVKVLAPNFPGSRRTSSWTYWKREALAYQSDLASALPTGLTTPKCYFVSEVPGKQISLWLEEVVEGRGKKWPLARYFEAARLLGQLGGTFLSRRRMPQDRWLNREFMTGALFDTVSQSLLAPQLWASPLARRAFSRQTAAKVRRLVEGRGRLVRAYRRLPRTLTHFDAFRPNLMFRHSRDGTPEYVLLDWSYVGIGALGAELSSTVCHNLLWLETRGEDAARFRSLAWEGYLAGLRDRHWRGSSDQVRLGFLLSVALNLTSQLPFFLNVLADSSRHDYWKRKFGAPPKRCVDEWGLAVTFLIDATEELQPLLSELH